MSPPETNGEPSKRYRRAARRYPELLLFPDDNARKQAVKRAWRAQFKAPSYWLILFAITVMGAFFCYGSISLQHSSLSKSLRGMLILGFHVIYPLFVLIGRIWLRCERQRSLRLQLQEMHVPVCLHCGYDLRGQTEARSSECGQPFDPALLKSDARTSPPAGE